MSQKIAIACFEARTQTYSYAEFLHIHLQMQAGCTYAVFGVQFKQYLAFRKLLLEQLFCDIRYRLSN